MCSEHRVRRYVFAYAGVFLFGQSSPAFVTFVSAALCVCACRRQTAATWLAFPADKDGCRPTQATAILKQWNMLLGDFDSEMVLDGDEINPYKATWFVTFFVRLPHPIPCTHN